MHVYALNIDPPIQIGIQMGQNSNSAVILEWQRIHDRHMFGDRLNKLRPQTTVSKWAQTPIQ